jgi:plasmid stability protein
MPSLTLKDIPPSLHEQLRRRATRNRRSLSQEALACLEQATAGERVDVDRLLAQARRLRAGVTRVRQRDLRAWVTQGRP